MRRTDADPRPDSTRTPGPDGRPGPDRLRDRDGRSADELANVLTHGVGLVAALTGAAVLIVLASLNGDVREVVGASVFGTTLITLYAASTLYHAASHAGRSPKVRARLRVFDHAAIYLLIAGTYTPFLIAELRGGWGWSLFGVVWGLAVAGVGFKLVFAGRFRLVSTLLYVAMGWLALVAAGPMIRLLSPLTLAWLLAGGIAYTAGTPFYHATRIRYAHAIWHLFVLGGSVCHAVAVGTILV